MKASIFLIAFLLFAGVVTQGLEIDTVDTTVGKVRGLKVKAVNGKSLWSFRGIRYAMPPVGQLRFAKPVPYPKENWAKDVIKSRLNIESVSDDLASRLMYWYQTNSHLDPIIELQTDYRHTIRAYDILDTIARSRHTNVWFLHFNHFPDYLKDDVHGIIYNLDLLYLFDIDMDVVRQSYERYVTGDFDKENYELKTSFSALVAGFVLNGNPETPILTQISTGWPSYDLVGRYYLDFKSKPTVKRNWKKQIRELWEKDLPNWAYKQMENHHFEL